MKIKKNKKGDLPITGLLFLEKRVSQEIRKTTIVNRSKKADLPITILVIGVVFVCGLAIFSFYVASQNFEKDFNSVLMMQEMNYIERMNQFYRQVGDEKNIQPKLNEELKSGNFIYVLNKAEHSCEFVGNYSVTERSWIFFSKRVQKAVVSRKVAC